MFAAALALTLLAAPKGSTTDPDRVQLWTPTPAPPSDAPAPVVIYVHGYGTSVREAFAAHHLAAQFAASERNAIFIVPEAPSGPNEVVYFPQLERLLERAESELGRALSREGITIAGHSGAYRTLRAWLDHPGVRE